MNIYHEYDNDNLFIDSTENYKSEKTQGQSFVLCENLFNKKSITRVAFCT
jgi:hypothetical protein